MGQANLSITIITKNEKDRIGRLLKSVSFAKEIIVIDSGSTDGTQALCESMGVRVIFNEWPGYAAQKQHAMEMARSEWILNLDADEEISAELEKELTFSIDNAGPDVNGFSMPRLSRYLGRWIKHGGWYPDRKVRLVRKGKGTWQGSALHEQLVVEGKVHEITRPIFHHVYRGIYDQVITINKFSDIYATEQGAANGWFVLAGMFHCLGKFAECYLWKLGMLDGLPGLIIAMNSAWYVFLKHSKSWELGLGSENKPIE